MGAVGGPLQASCSGGGAGVHRLQPGQEPLQEKDARQEHKRGSMTRTREQIVEEIIDAVQDLFDNAEPTDESQIYQEYYYIPSRPLDLICLNLIPELDELDQVTQESKSTRGGA